MVHNLWKTRVQVTSGGQIKKKCEYFPKNSLPTKSSIIHPILDKSGIWTISKFLWYLLSPYQRSIDTFANSCPEWVSGSKVQRFGRCGRNEMLPENKRDSGYSLRTPLPAPSVLIFPGTLFPPKLSLFAFLHYLTCWRMVCYSKFQTTTTHSVPLLRDLCPGNSISAASLISIYVSRRKYLSLEWKHLSEENAGLQFCLPYFRIPSSVLVKPRHKSKHNNETILRKLLAEQVLLSENNNEIK